MIRETQRQAWADLQLHLSDRRRAVLGVIIEAGQLAAFEVAAYLGVPFHHVSGRITELNAMGLVEDSGLRRINPESEKEQIVWRWTERTEPLDVPKLTKDQKIQRLREAVHSAAELLADGGFTLMAAALLAELETIK